MQSPSRRISTGGQLKHAAAKKGPGSAAGRRTPAVLTESGERRAGKIRVLIAEDNAINMKVARGILDRMGYKQARALHATAEGFLVVLSVVQVPMAPSCSCFLPCPPVQVKSALLVYSTKKS